MKTNEKIRTMRELNKWSQEEMAEKLEMSASGYARIERGETQLNLTRLQQIADIFKIDLWELIQSNQGMILQINHENNDGQFCIYADNTPQMSAMKVEIDCLKDLLIQKDKEIEFLREMLKSYTNPKS
ncbi:helix-turn-helix domain-containing protein [Kingella kingae]|nr:helix-turn-helix transcriptional regulator [Kingella kingae]MDK4530871.1 helix-turn-helix transcriptional regulator [Kingella kingae]MDK4534182.1 helix-turn-helix transcriptional regulator [Kingella kingae]MDK4540621.1 helix-turn-helix transcriptional regulator [Kingella kingae]MDK4553291.1 helix-turn-helix transcriptional regulator [Kingella kingae]MDK4580183.1 helix-turn-helix transcriptional regulator [Kingella kingae]